MYMYMSGLCRVLGEYISAYIYIYIYIEENMYIYIYV